ncbi:GlxA family transcriptional regulator [Dyadobacter arcticus]|uniref:Transcriptional regulator GlxA family with amidase domain n=1 Tax=Dyadobacter arcticus TaxID=1078754 RepID=A0ABX0UEX2_9BACT|nr:helix-turn-helix domain-containing protein [Dyadobacter arcticus]NIJ51462.1 transcriptional regulator GlxA family with amidase domain [Dyadobacter arcticus]
MVQLGLLITNKHRLLSVAALLDVFESVNSFYERINEPAFFNINLFSSDNQPGAYYGSYAMQSIQNSGQMDLILVPAFGAGDLGISVSGNKMFIPWLWEQRKKGAEIASFCTGAFLLAAAGLLNGKEATTHIDSAQALASNFPEIIMKSDAVVTDDSGIYTSGGATSSFHLMLYLIQRRCGKELTLKTAKMFAIDMDREQQTYFGTFSPSQNHGDGLVNMAQQKIEKEYQEGSTIETLIQDIPASRRNVVRRFKQAIGVTPIEYLQRTRIEAAKKLLAQTDQSVLEVMLNSGYNDLKSFRQLFKKSTGVTPKEYRDKFNIARLENTNRLERKSA